MRSLGYSLFFILLISVISCDSANEPTPVNDPDTDNDQDTVTVTGWETNFPQVVNGTTTLDIMVSTKREAKVYYIISGEAIDSPTPETVKSNAVSTSENMIVKNGSLNIEGNEVNDTVIKTLEGLEEGKTYYTYLALEINDTLAAPVSAFTSKMAIRQSKEMFHSDEEARDVKYLAYKPEEYYKNPEKVYPLLVFLAGSGSVNENGELNLLQNNTLPMFIDKGNDYPFIVVSPQPIQSRWDSVLVDEMVEEAKEMYRVDESRIYITGISGGGYGAWRYAFSFPEKVAAIVPIAGAGVPSLVCPMREVPVWAFHGSEDNVVKLKDAQAMVNALKQCGPSTEPILTVYPGVGHESWERTYDKSAGHDIFAWLLTHKKK